MKNLLLFILMLSPMLASAQTVSDVKDNDCHTETLGGKPTIVLTKEGSTLSVQLLNYEENCCTDYFNVTSSISDGNDSVSIIVAPDAEYICTCHCPFNVSFTVRDLEPNSFYLDCWWYKGLVELTEGQTYQATYGGSFYSYHPFLKEGKTWNYYEYYHNLWDNQQWKKEVSYVINGTTEIDGKTYYKMYRISEEGEKYYCALREEDRKVWQYTSNEGDHLLYDFGMSVGDSYKPTYETYNFQLTSITPMRFHDDQLLNVLFYDMFIQYDTEPRINFASVPIVEGVGCENGWNIVDWYAAQPTNGIIHGEQFLSCYEDGKCIFTADDFNNLAAVDNIAYRPFIEEGKVWKVGQIGSAENPHPALLVEYYYFDGDTIIDGRTCKQMMCQRHVSPDYEDYEIIMHYPLLRSCGEWYEEDKKVYCYDASSKQFTLRYDFSLEANDTLWLYQQPYVVGPRQTGGLKGFKGVYRDIFYGQNYLNNTWLEGVGSIEGPIFSVYYGKEGHGGAFLMSCTVGDEVIYLNDEFEDGATPAEARKRIDFTHTIKTRPKMPRRETDTSQGEEDQLYGEYNNLQLDINLNPLDDAYLVRITDETGKAVYEKNVNAASIVGLNIDISTYAEGRYTVTVENSQESFTGVFETVTTGISDAERLNDNGEMINDHIYNLQGQRIRSPQKGLNILNGQKVFVK
ncbi:MAG: DUF3244 domain-containing protein [Prevotella sp.]|nr:DUF3244 domain-containing protein [Prevotella sp.]